METVTIPKREYDKLKAAYEKQKLVAFLEKRLREAEKNLQKKTYTRADLGF